MIGASGLPIVMILPGCSDCSKLNIFKYLTVSLVDNSDHLVKHIPNIFMSSSLFFNSSSWRKGACSHNQKLRLSSSVGSDDCKEWQAVKNKKKYIAYNIFFIISPNNIKY